MNKELFVSTTPHETRVGLVEDDLLAEIYLERENEYTLAGSIYKGRVTRVLPGMQSAFVDIGLERDAFLYVSDFMELEDTDDVDEIPAARQAAPSASASGRSAARSGRRQSSRVKPSRSWFPEKSDSQSVPAARVIWFGDRQERGGWRGRRRRGRGGRRGERSMPESKFTRPAAAEPVAEATMITVRRRDTSRFCFPENRFQNIAATSRRSCTAGASVEECESCDGRNLSG